MELISKQGQPSTYSPRTQDSNRRRLGNLFAFATSSGSPVAAHTAKASPLVADVKAGSSDDSEPSWSRVSASQGSGLEHVAGLSLDKLSLRGRSDAARGNGKGKHGMNGDLDEGCFVDTREASVGSGSGEASRAELSSSADKKEEPSLLMRLPDELLLHIISHLPSAASQLLLLARVNRRMGELAQESRFWAHLFHSTPGYDFSRDAASRIVSTPDAPKGSWVDGEWVWSEGAGSPSATPVKHTDRAQTSPTASTASPAAPSMPSVSRSRTASIPVHYPTLYRSRHRLSGLVRCPTPTHRPAYETIYKEPTTSGASADVTRTESVYCLHAVGRWLITGSRDHSIRLWRLGSFSSIGRPGRTRLIKTVPRAHGGSVLSLHFELDAQGRGTLITGSSDRNAVLWDLDFSARPSITKRSTLRGHEGGVLDVLLSERAYVTCSKDATVRVYDRRTEEVRFVLAGHELPVNCLALSPDGTEVASASGDGSWAVWDLTSGREVRRKTGEARGLACIAWEGEYIVTGDNNRHIRLFDARSTEVLREFRGHTDLVRIVGLNLVQGIIVSGSYDQTIRMWDLHTGAEIRRIANQHRARADANDPQTSLIFDLQVTATRIISASHDGSVQVVCLATGLPYLDLFA